MPNIPVIKVGNQVFEIKDVTAREHLVEVSETRPTSVDNRLWIKDEQDEYTVPTMDDLNNWILVRSGKQKIDIPPNSGETYHLDIPDQEGYLLLMVNLGLSGYGSAMEGCVFQNDPNDLRSVVIRNTSSRLHDWNVLWSALFVKPSPRGE